MPRMIHGALRGRPYESVRKAFTVVQNRIPNGSLFRTRPQRISVSSPKICEPLKRGGATKKRAKLRLPSLLSLPSGKPENTRLVAAQQYGCDVIKAGL